MVAFQNICLSIFMTCTVKIKVKMLRHRVDNSGRVPLESYHTLRQPLFFPEDKILYPTQVGCLVVSFYARDWKNKCVWVGMVVFSSFIH